VHKTPNANANSEKKVNAKDPSMVVRPTKGRLQKGIKSQKPPDYAYDTVYQLEEENVRNATRAIRVESRHTSNV
jgi:hypothetical protein